MKLGFVMINHKRSIQILHQGTGSNKGCLISLIEMKGLLGRNPRYRIRQISKISFVGWHQKTKRMGYLIPKMIRGYSEKYQN